jgi:glucose/mannose transport system permease protein
MSATTPTGTAANARWTVYLMLLGLAVVFLAPLAVVVLTSLRPDADMMRHSLIGWPGAITLKNYPMAWSHFCIAERCTGVAPYVVNSLLMTLPATVISTLLGSVAGFSIALWRFRGDTAMFALVTLGVFLPEQMRLIPWVIVLRDIGLSDTITGLVVVHVTQGLSFTALFCRNYYMAIPQDLIKAARIDGAGFYRIFWRIVLPLSPPILIVCTIWQFTGIWNEFLYGVTFLNGPNQPITAAIIAISATVTTTPQYGVQSAAVLLAALPTLVVYLFGGKYFMRGLTAGAVR